MTRSSDSTDSVFTEETINAVLVFAKCILHGDDVHRTWLLEAADAFVARKPLPEPRSLKPKWEEVQEAIDDLAAELDLGYIIGGRNEKWECGQCGGKGFGPENVKHEEGCIHPAWDRLLGTLRDQSGLSARLKNNEGHSVSSKKPDSSRERGRSCQSGAMKPSGRVCKCGSPKSEHDFFCAVCTAKLPPALIYLMVKAHTNSAFRNLIRRAVVILGLPESHNAKRKKLYVIGAFIAFLFAAGCSTPRHEPNPIDIPKGMCLVIFQDHSTVIVSIDAADEIEDHNPNFLGAACNP